ncbi:hypothetical protein LINPERHAP1_LOCUS37658, partial [Linum perenne]
MMNISFNFSFSSYSYFWEISNQPFVLLPVFAENLAHDIIGLCSYQRVLMHNPASSSPTIIRITISRTRSTIIISIPLSLISSSSNLPKGECLLDPNKISHLVLDLHTLCVAVPFPPTSNRPLKSLLLLSRFLNSGICKNSIQTLSGRCWKQLPRAFVAVEIVFWNEIHRQRLSPDFAPQVK